MSFSEAHRFASRNEKAKTFYRPKCKGQNDFNLSCADAKIDTLYPAFLVENNIHTPQTAVFYHFSVFVCVCVFIL